jgi:hypothetical protein
MQTCVNDCDPRVAYHFYLRESEVVISYLTQLIFVVVSEIDYFVTAFSRTSPCPLRAGQIMNVFTKFGANPSQNVRMHTCNNVQMRPFHARAECAHASAHVQIK